MSHAELELWAEFRRRKGFPTDRLTGGVAISGAASCQAWGAKVRPEDLLPEFGRTRARGVSGEALIAYLSALPGAKVEHN